MRSDRVSRNAGYALATQLIGAILTGSLMIFLGRALGPEEYGLFAFAMSVMVLATLLADFGISASAGRFIAERFDDRPGAAAVFRVAVRVKFVLAGAAGALLFVLAEPICDVFGSPGATWALRWAAVALIGQSMMLLVFGAFAALRLQRFSVVLAAGESAVEVAASVALVLAGLGAAGAAFGRVVGYAAGLALGLVIAARVIGRPERRAGGRGATIRRQIMVYAGPLLLVDAAFRVFSTIDVLLISAILGGGAAVALYELPMRLITFVDYPAAALASAVAPRMARRPGAPPDVGMLEAALRVLVLVQMVFVVPVLVWPEAIVSLLFGPGYEESASVLRALAPYVLLSGLAQPVTLAVNYLGEARRRVPIALAMLLVNVVIDVALLSTVGVVAAGIGTSAAYLVWVPAHVWILHRRAGLRVRPLLATGSRALLAAGAMAVVLVAIGTGDVPAWGMALGAIAGPAAYLLALVALGEVGRDDAGELRAILRRAPAAEPESSSSYMPHSASHHGSTPSRDATQAGADDASAPPTSSAAASVAASAAGSSDANVRTPGASR